jgi:hypothetical protein
VLHVRVPALELGEIRHRVYPICAQEAFQEGHIDAFNALRGVPADKRAVES